MSRVAADAVLALDHFKPLLQQRFLLIDESGVEHTADLLEAAPLSTPSFQGRAPFSLVFRGPAQPSLPQREYTLQHPAFEALSLFLVPLGQDAQGTRYEAIFN